MTKRWRVEWDETEIPDGDYVRAADFEAAIRRIQHTVDCHVPVGEVRDILLEMCSQELPSQFDREDGSGS